MSWLSTRKSLWISAALALALALGVHSLPLDSLEAPFFDALKLLKPSFRPDPEITLLKLDSATTDDLNQIAPLPLETHLQIIKSLRTQHPKAVGLIVDFNRVERLDPENFKRHLPEFEATLRALEHDGTLVLLGNDFDVNGEVTAPAGLQHFPQSVAIIHRDGNVFGKDRVTRRALVSIFNRNAFEMALASKLTSPRDLPLPLGTFSAKESDSQFFLMDLPQASYRQVSALDVIKKTAPVQDIFQKIILIGSLQNENPNDFALTNRFGKNALRPKLELHGAILDNILNQRSILKVPFTLNYLLSSFIAFVIITLAFTLRPSRFLRSSGAIFIGSIVLSGGLFCGGIWLPIVPTLFTLIFSFYLTIPLRLYSENQRRFELEKQNQLMKEVEEMKTNFLQLVTHDLKTPVARMQALLEQIKRGMGDKLDTHNLALIENSFLAIDELNHFISSLLELTRLDSHGIRVDLKSKDINLILEQVLQKHSFAAQSKQIFISTQFEPLFPIKIDPELISKVLSNLIDNAIKYSPEKSTVFIETLEDNVHIEIKVRDQGRGISPDGLSKLFTRFYRVKTPETDSIKGTGLGLYLSKFFIEAHQGSISVKSALGLGTEFTVKLPLKIESKEKMYA